MMWKILTAVLILGIVSKIEALDCINCIHSSVVPNPDCLEGRSRVKCSNAAHCLTYFGNVTFITPNAPQNQTRDFLVRACSPVPTCDNPNLIPPLHIPGDASYSRNYTCRACNNRDKCNSAERAAVGKITALMLVVVFLGIRFFPVE